MEMLIVMTFGLVCGLSMGIWVTYVIMKRKCMENQFDMNVTDDELIAGDLR